MQKIKNYVNELLQYKLKLILFLFSTLLITIPSSSAQIAENIGLKQHFIVETGGYEFPVGIVSNFNVVNIEFSSEEKKLTFFIDNALENNISEILIPINLINGNFTFYLNDKEIFPTVKQNEEISFITIEFQGIGKHRLDIIGTTYLPEFSEFVPLILTLSLLGAIFVKKVKNVNFLNYSFNKD